MGFTYAIEEWEPETAAYLTGRLSHADHDRFHEIVQAMQQGRHSRFVIDLTGLESIDSAGLGMLLMARETMSGSASTLFLRRPGGQVLRMLRLLEFHHLFNIE